jgi:ATP-dependent RNA helicase DDX54/DBP10
MFGVGSWENAEAKPPKKKSGGFQSMGLTKELLSGIKKMNFAVPTPIQRKAIPPLLQRSDVVAMARTGSGKTAAYLIPMLFHLKEHSKIVGIRGVVLSPTRELALQILTQAKKLGRFTNLQYCALVGGTSLDQQFEELASNPDIVIATPGRLLHVVEEASLALSLVKSVVLDEADRLFELGLQPQIVAILHKVPDSSQRALFSATMPSVLAEFTNAGLTNPVTIRLDAEMKLSDKLKQSAFLVRSDEKIAALIVILKRIIDIGAQKAQALVFVESKHHVEMLEAVLAGYMIPCSAIHGQMDQEARKNSVADFTRRKTAVMVVTDVAARGLDIPLLDNVINFSFPHTPKLFVHRVGRVARAGRSGSAFSIMTFDDMSYYIDLMKFLQRPMQNRQQEGDLLFVADDGCYGRLPEDDLHLELDYIRRLAVENVEVRNILKVADNAHKKYGKTKKKATHESIQEARQQEHQFEAVALHPMLLEGLGSKLIEADGAKLDLRRFKAKESVLDIIHGGKIFEITKKATIQNTKTPVAAAVITGTKKLTLAESMLLRAQERKRAREEDEETQNTATAFQDREFFMPLERRETHEDAHYSVKDATIDITPETAAEAQQQRMVFAWNKKKNRYTKMHVNDAKAMLRGMKNESGKSINFKSKLEAYSRWMKKSNLRIQDAGEDEDLGAIARAKQAASAKGSNVTVEGDDEDIVDISDPNQGKKLRIGRKQRRLPKDGRVRSFDEVRTMKKKEQKEKARNSKKSKGGKRK